MSVDPKIEAALSSLPEPDLTDPDNPEWTEDDFARAKPAEAMLPSAVLSQFARPPGRPKAATRKVQVTLRLDPDVLDHFKQTGTGWQSRINAALKKSVG
jgi:uncharacterized protein (DUF4415 family)